MSKVTNKKHESYKKAQASWNYTFQLIVAIWMYITFHSSLSNFVTVGRFVSKFTLILLKLKINIIFIIISYRSNKN